MDKKKIKIISISVFIVFLIAIAIYSIILRYNTSVDNEKDINNKKRNNYSYNYNIDKENKNGLGNSSNSNTDSNTNDGGKLNLDVIEDTDPWGENVPINQANLNLITDNTEYSYFLVKQCIYKFCSSSENAYNVLDSKLRETNKSKYYEENNGLNFCIDKIFKAPVRDSKDIYYVYYRLQNKSTNGVINKQLILKIDKKNVLFSIYPYEFLKEINYTDLKENDKISLDVVSIEDIERNSYNMYNARLIKKDDLVYVQELIDRTKFEIQHDLINLYNKVDEEYKEVIFDNDIKIFERFINNKKENYLKDVYKGYQIYPQEDYLQYIAVFENSLSHYVFNMKNLMNYTIQFDNYSTALPPYMEIYEMNYSHIKAKYCIDRVRKAINDNNYRFIYNKLNSIQRNNYYKNYDEFENFIKTYFYKENTFDYGDCIRFSDNLYQYTISAKNSSNSLSYNRKFNMTVELKENGDFRISITL